MLDNDIIGQLKNHCLTIAHKSHRMYLSTQK